jgi:hypothetical protein
MRPLCYNGEAMASYPANEGRVPIATNIETMTVDVTQRVTLIPWAFTQKCMSWASDPSTDPVPMAENWRCAGCRHFPADLVELAEKRRQERPSRPTLRHSPGTSGG